MDARSGLVLSVRQVTATFGGDRPVLCEVSFDLPAGAILGVAGEPGSGRTTLARVLTGDVDDFTGRLTLRPRDGGPEITLRAGTPRPSRAERLAAASPRVLDATDPVLTPRQRHADVLVIDDAPAASLTALARLRDRHGCAIVVTCTDPAALRGVADEVAVLYGGRIVEHGRAEDVYAGPHHPHTIDLFAGGSPGEGRPADAPGCPYRTRCAYRMGICDDLDPALDLVTVGSGGTTMTACLQYDRAVPDPALSAASGQAAGQQGYASPRDDVQPRK
ncbi:ABC-type glutathione transport system ATPase component [Catenuloplanes nepalensis]|uniref:ABC-type glutathione transport system ATPase component n=1 Tax=Catenuloplanes nepalensis TaxID=587533 RepID=A0ABT9MSY2_9ACTN|nr:ATP-binding cassette domain-containing protein [Catenuloplanes nepalensis]MDP9794559.1 ABC-type glutathione transport system ATPase component [Catenuloplanes nepalensis]